MGNTLGIDAGTNSLGLFVRKNSGEVIYHDQIEFCSVELFDSGVGNGKNGEFSLAANRTKFRGQRNLYKIRKYRKWSTLKLLIENELCPLRMEELNRWRHYNKYSEKKHEYPVDSLPFQQWIRLDFDCDGKPDYNNPYELRAELATVRLDLSVEENRYKLGRALYHIAQRRGFKSSKGETLSSQLESENSEEGLKQSESERIVLLEKYMECHGFKTIGCAFNSLIKEGIRIRANEEFQAIRKQYKTEIVEILKAQGLCENLKLYKGLTSERKGEGTIFYKRPLKSQKGVVGKCTLEPSKSRCYISRPEYEHFRAWAFINNIRYGVNCSETLPLALKEKLYKDRFVRATDFKFEQIRKQIEKELNIKVSYDKNVQRRTINFKDNIDVSCCPVTYRLKELLGEDWYTWHIGTSKIRKSFKNGCQESEHTVSYNWEDIWHICLTSDDEEELVNGFKNIDVDFYKVKKLWNTIKPGYANLSLKAIKNINRFQEKGLGYSSACLLAKLPEIFKDRWNSEVEFFIINHLDSIIKSYFYEKKIFSIVNTLVSKYKVENCSSVRRYETNKEFDIEYIVDEYGENTWRTLSQDEQNNILNNVSDLYQTYFEKDDASYFKMPTLKGKFTAWLKEEFKDINVSSLDKIYHHSQIEYYKPASYERVKTDNGFISVKLLQSPVLTSLRNPMALRVLHTLRRKVNDLITSGIIDSENTRIVVEVARELNDANMRWAINTYNEKRADENKEYEKAVERHLKDSNIDATKLDIRKIRLLVEQHDFLPLSKKEGKIELRYEKFMDEMIKKYRLWIEQGGICIYTGKIINISSLFNEGIIDIEHTIPRSKSFDDSLENQTLCYAFYNRNVKQNRMPSSLSEHDDILLRIKPWYEKIEILKNNLNYWRHKAKSALTKEAKDNCIRQQHLWRMELNYWQNKVSRFTMTEITNGFRNNQLVDTNIISKYAYHFLKSVFNKVEVQRGTTTAVFRKLLGLQEKNAKKDRTNHLHHAMDAAVLSFIPSSVHRDKILKLYYEIKELKMMGHDTSNLEYELNKEYKYCGFDKIAFESIKEYIEKSVFVHHHKKHQEFNPTIRKYRIGGRVVPKKDELGNVIYETNADGTYKKDRFGHTIVSPKFKCTGLGIRGEINESSLYGAIRKPQIDENNSPKRDENGIMIIVPKNYYVIRRELKYKKNDNDTGFKTWNDLENAIVDKSLFKLMKEQFPKDTTFKDAIEQGIYMLKYIREKGEIVKCVKKYRIRHVRCFASGVSNAQEVKMHTHLSSKEYKQFVYTKSSEIYAIGKYKNDVETEFVAYNILELSKSYNVEGDIPLTISSKKNRNGNLSLVQKIRKGDHLLLYKKDPTELYDLDDSELSKRLYVVDGIEKPYRITITKHSIMSKEKGESAGSMVELPHKIRQSVASLHYLTENVDFEFCEGKIVFKSSHKGH